MKRKSSKYRRVVAVIAFIFLILVYCASLRVPDTNLPNLSRKDVLGTWRLSKGSMRKINILRPSGKPKLPSDNFIVLREDGSYSLRTYMHIGYYSGEYMRSDGTWKLRKEFEPSLSYLGTNIVDMSTEFSEFYVGKKRGRLVLFKFIGDPNRNWTIEFELSESNEK